MLSLFHWLFVKLKTRCPFSSHSLWLFSCWLRWSFWSFERCSLENIFKLSVSAAASVFCEWVQTNKTKESITPQKLSSQNFWQIANSVLYKDKSARPPLSNRQEVLSSAPDKEKLFAKNIFKNSNLEDSDISLTAFLSRTNLKLHNFYVWKRS